MAGKRAAVGARVGAAAGRERKAQTPAGRSATSDEAIGGALLARGTEGEPGEAGTEVGGGAWGAPPQADSGEGRRGHSCKVAGALYRPRLSGKVAGGED